VVLPCLHKIPLASLQALSHQDDGRCSFIPHVHVLPLIRVLSSAGTSMNPVTYMTTIRGVKPLLTKVCCILLGLRDLQCVWKLVHVTFLTPIILRRLQIIFFFYFLKLGLTHPAAYMHIYTAEEMIQCLKQFCMEG